MGQDAGLTRRKSGRESVCENMESRDERQTLLGQAARAGR